VKVYTEPEKVEEMLGKARDVYKKRDARIEGMTDETTDIFYSCTLCQSFALTTSVSSVRKEPDFAALTTGWIARPRLK